MHRITLLSVVCLFFALSTISAQEKKDKTDPEKKPEVDKKKAETIKKEKQKLQGAWEVLDWVNNGEPMPADQVKLMRVEFSGDNLFMSLPKTTGKREYTFTLDPTAKPKAIDTTPNVTKIKVKTHTAGIYEFEDETLRLCLARFGSGIRPKEFESKAGTGNVLITMKRAKK